MGKRGNMHLKDSPGSNRFKPGNEEWKKRRFFKHGLVAMLKQKFLEQSYTVTEDGKEVKKIDKKITYKDDLYTSLLASVIAKAMQGDTWAQQQIIHMIDGKIPDKQQVSGDPDNPTPIPIVRLPAKDPTIGDTDAA